MSLRSSEVWFSLKATGSAAWHAVQTIAEFAEGNWAAVPQLVYDVAQRHLPRAVLNVSHGLVHAGL